MRWLRMAACLLVLSAFSGVAEAKKSKGTYSGTGSSSSSHGVRGHVTKKGKYVKPHRATNPNKTKRDNYSTKGNRNPATGKKGTKLVDR